jgi:hypothetical protein
MNIGNKKRLDSLFSLALGAWFILFVCPSVLGDDASLNTLPQLSEQNSSTVMVEHPDNETIYSITSGDCTIEWIARNSEIGVIKHRARCTAPLSQQRQLLTQICTEFFSKDINAQSFRSLFLGSLRSDEGRPGSQEMSLRLALAAHKSPGWDVKRGRPKNGDMNRFVKDLANREMIYPELKELFESINKSIKFSCAEKVLVSEAEKLPFFDQLKQHGIKARDRLPYDCMTWFSVSAQ